MHEISNIFGLYNAGNYWQKYWETTIWEGLMYQKLGGAIETSTGITEGIAKLERKNEFNERTSWSAGFCGFVLPQKECTKYHIER